eukprot:15449295-Alexandrium_andersonii.AAC.1
MWCPPLPAAPGQRLPRWLSRPPWLPPDACSGAVGAPPRAACRAATAGPAGAESGRCARRGCGIPSLVADMGL